MQAEVGKDHSVLDTNAKAPTEAAKEDRSVAEKS